MNESVYLRRSLSQPTDSFRDEGDRLRCLSESVSLGRFMTEPLAWERWSTFSHNRYLEEAERHSRPGSVAAKKAYFEAHFKKKAAERAVALAEEDKAHDDDGGDEGKDVEVVGNEENPIFESGGLVGCLNSKDVCEGSVQEVDEESSSNHDEISTKTCDDNEDQTFEEDIKLVREECPASEDRVASSSPRKPCNEVLLPPTKQPTRVLARKENKFGMKSEKFAKDLAKKTSEKSLHMSIQFSFQAREKSKTTTTTTNTSVCSSSQIAQKMRSLKNLTTSLNVPKKISASLQTKPKPCVNGTSKRPLINLLSDETRNSKCCNGKATKPRSSSPIVSAPFSLRSEARAVKRKEFYEKLEERRNAEEAASKKHPQTKNQPKSSAFGTKPSCSKTKGTTTLTSRPLNTTTKIMAVEDGQNVNRSVTSFSRKNSRENASPNILNTTSKK